MMKTVSLIFLVLCVGSIVDARGLTPRVIRGKDAIDGQFPYQASLRHKENNGLFCGASIISTRHLLTAAHCTQGTNSNPLFVVAVVGSIDRRKGVTITLNKITPHEKWDGNRLLNDISLVRTVSEIIFSDTIQPIALPTQDLPDENDTAVVVSGWGKISMSVCINSE